jgi:MscS family membrane protein
MQQILTWLSDLNQNYQWAVTLFVVVFITLVVNYIWKRYYANVQARLIQTENLWDDALWEAVHKPMGYLIWVLGFTYALEISRAPEVDAELLSLLRNIRAITVIGLLAWFLFRFIHLAETNILTAGQDEKRQVDKTTVNAVAKLLRASVIITAILITMQTMGYSISGLLAFGGIGGLAVGFAAKDLLSNFFGGLMIYLDRPFKIGDWIRSPDRNIEGVVEYIGWRQTRIRTFDKRPLYVPNSIFTSITVENPSRMLNRRIYETIGIRYDDANKMGEIVTKVKAMLRNHPAIDTSATLIVNFNAFAASSLDFFVYTFTKTTDWIEYHEIKQDVLLQIIAIIEGEGAEIAFPTQTLHMQAPWLQETEDKTLA